MVLDGQPAPLAGFQALQAAAQLAVARCRLLAGCTEIPGETTRTFLCEPMRQVHETMAEWMAGAGMEVRVDAVGNLRGLAGSPEAPRLVIASHLDTVPQAGAFDGILGVVLGISVVEQLARLPFAIEVIGFSEEEGIRFRKPFLGSMAAAGTLASGDLCLVDHHGTTVADAIRQFGLDPEDLVNARFSPRVFGYLEFHIEQGPLLESVGAPLGIVAALVGQTRMELIFEGQANHAGTTPMHLRRDAMAAAAEWMTHVESYAREHVGLVATVGRVTTQPGAGNVIAGRVSASLDLRHVEDAVRDAAAVDLLGWARRSGDARGVRVSHAVLMEQPAVRLNADLLEVLGGATRDAGYHAPVMTSGAGHDAMIVAPHIASAMLFLRSPGGLSHHPDETVLPEDVEAALATGLAFVHRLAQARSLETA